MNDDFISTLPFEIHVDDGVVEGFIKTNPIMGDLKFSNVTTDLLNLFPLDYSESIKGNILITDMIELGIARKFWPSFQLLVTEPAVADSVESAVILSLSACVY